MMINTSCAVGSSGSLDVDGTVAIDAGDSKLCNLPGCAGVGFFFGQWTVKQCIRMEVTVFGFQQPFEQSIYFYLDHFLRLIAARLLSRHCQVLSHFVTLTHWLILRTFFSFSSKQDSYGLWILVWLIHTWIMLNITGLFDIFVAFLVSTTISSPELEVSLIIQLLSVDIFLVFVSLLESCVSFSGLEVSLTCNSLDAIIVVISFVSSLNLKHISVSVTKKLY